MDDITARQVFAMGLILLALGGFGAAEIRDRWRDWRAAHPSKKLRAKS